MSMWTIVAIAALTIVVGLTVWGLAHVLRGSSRRAFNAAVREVTNHRLGLEPAQISRKYYVLAAIQFISILVLEFLLMLVRNAYVLFIVRPLNSVFRSRRTGMEFTVIALGKSYTFRLDDQGARHLAPIVLPEWEPFRSENSGPGHDGQKVMLECSSLLGDDEEGMASVEAYGRTLTFFLRQRQVIAQNALIGLVGYVHQLREDMAKLGYDDPELEAVARPEDLRALIGLSYVHLFPYQKGGIPYIGLEFECNWDPEHACGVMLLGTRVLECGQSGTGRGIDFYIESDGGAI